MLVTALMQLCHIYETPDRARTPGYSLDFNINVKVWSVLLYVSTTAEPVTDNNKPIDVVCLERYRKTKIITPGAEN